MFVHDERFACIAWSSTEHKWNGMKKIKHENIAYHDTNTRSQASSWAFHAPASLKTDFVVDWYLFVDWWKKSKKTRWREEAVRHNKQQSLQKQQTPSWWNNKKREQFEIKITLINPLLRLFGAKWLFVASFIGGRCAFCGHKQIDQRYSFASDKHLHKIKLNRQWMEQTANHLQDLLCNTTNVQW